MLRKKATPKEGASNDLLDIRYYQPSREGRRRLAGRPCQMCGLPLHHTSIIAIEILREKDGPADKTVFIHNACLRLLTDQVNSIQGPGTANGGGTPAAPAE